MPYITKQYKIIRSCLIAIVCLMLFSGLQVRAAEEVKFVRLFDSDYELTGAILQDQDGFIWIGTSGGVFIYDGLQLKPFTSAEMSFSGIPISNIKEDPDGHIWISTDTYGLFKYNKETDSFTNWKHDKQDPNSLSGPTIDYHTQSLCIDQKGIIWVGTEMGLNRIDPDTGKVTQFKNDPKDPNSLSSNAITSIYQEQSGILWVGTSDKGINQFDTTTGRFTRYLHDPADSKSLSDNYVLSILEDRSNVLWFGTRHGGLNRFNRKTGDFMHFRHKPDNPNSIANDHILTITEDKTGMLCVLSVSMRESVPYLMIVSVQ